MPWLGSTVSDICGRLCGKKRIEKTFKVLDFDGAYEPKKTIDLWNPPRSLKSDSEEYSLKIWMQNSLHLFNHSSPERATLLARKICERDMDVVALCEVFDERARAAFIEVFKEEGKYASAVTKAGGLTGGLASAGEDSGLFIVSKFPLKQTDIQFIYFDVDLISTSYGLNDDALAAKGCLICTFSMGPGLPPLVVAHTHMQAWRKGEQIRSKQLSEEILPALQEMISGKSSTEPEPIIFLMGDLNFTDVMEHKEGKGLSAKEYPRQTKLIKEAFPNAEDLYRQMHPNKETNPGYTADCVENQSAKIGKEDRDNHVRERVDYIWLLHKGGVGVGCRSIEVEKCEDNRKDGHGNLSDHYGLSAQITITPNDSALRGANAAA